MFILYNICYPFLYQGMVKGKRDPLKACKKCQASKQSGSKIMNTSFKYLQFKVHLKKPKKPTTFKRIPLQSKNSIQSIPPPLF